MAAIPCITDQMPKWAKSAGRGLTQGVTLGYADEATSALGTILARSLEPELFPESPQETYRGAMDVEQQRITQAREEAPVSYTLGEILGAMVNPATMAGGQAVAAGKGIKGAMALGGAEGAAYGFGTGYGTEDRFKKAATDAAIGTVSAGIAKGLMDDIAAKGGFKPWAKNIIDDETGAIGGAADDVITDPATRKQNFQNWFGDSKVVDDAGEPLTVYHGAYTPEEITEFAPSRSFQGTGLVWFSPSKRYAAEYGKNNFKGSRTGTAVGKNKKHVIPAHIKAQNIYYADSDPPLKGAGSLAEKLKASGYDAYAPFGRRGTPANKLKELAVIKPTQIKSIHNKGTYNPNDPRILYGFGALLGAGTIAKENEGLNQLLGGGGV